MKTARLCWRLLRYRVAVMLVLFFLLSVSLHQALTVQPGLLLLACLSLALSYVSATSVNDIADAQIDAINHPHSIGRPLITGEGRKRDLARVFVLASLGALLLAACINWRALLIVAASILINVLYSWPPVRFSYRTFLAPLVLGLAYVGVPYTLGLAVARTPVRHTDVGWFLGLYVMFVGRIILKDFRDRKGDAAFHKPTFVLRFGKPATCLVSSAGVVIGGGIMVGLTHREAWLAVIIVLYLAAVLAMLRRLQVSPAGRQEQLSIGVGAKMGNGLLITLLGVFALQRADASTQAQCLLAGLLTLVFFANYGYFLYKPEAALIGYRG